MLNLSNTQIRAAQAAWAEREDLSDTDFLGFVRAQVDLANKIAWEQANDR